MKNTFESRGNFPSPERAMPGRPIFAAAPAPGDPTAKHLVGVPLTPAPQNRLACLHGTLVQCRHLLWLLLGVLILLPNAAQAQSGVLNQTRYEQWSRANVGVPGGIPSGSWTQCGSTIAAYGSSSSPGDVTTVNNAIASCGTNQYVLLGPGTFWLNGGLDYSVNHNGHVAVRGSGPNSTILEFASGVGCFQGQSGVCFYNSNGFSGGSPQVQPGGPNAFNWNAGFSQGATSITISGVGSAGIGNGDMIVLDQKNDTSDNGGEVICDQNVSFVCLTEGPAYVGRTISGIDYQQEQIVKVLAGCPCSGAGPFTLTITPGLYANNWNGTGAVGGFFVKPAQMVGVENLTIDNPNGSLVTNVACLDTDGWWVKNVRSLHGHRNHMWAELCSHGEYRDSYMFGTLNGATESYGWEYSGADSLFENNITQQVASPNIGPGASSGNVFAYNFAIDDYYVGASGAFLQVPYFAHDAGNSFNLYEGNQWPSLACDDTHGTSALDTAFRNRFNGRDYNTAGGAGNQPTQDTQAVSFSSYCRGFNIIGNVLGTPGFHTNYQGVAIDTSQNNTATGAFCNTAIYDLGSGIGLCRGGGGINDDPLVASTMMRWGNYDTANAAVRWDSAESSPAGVAHIAAQSTPASRALPASFYLPSQPSWWSSSVPYPAIGPDVSGGNGPGGFAYNIPAANCYYNVMKGQADGGGGFLAFDASSCYGGSSASAPAAPSPAPPTNLTAVPH